MILMCIEPSMNFPGGDESPMEGKQGPIQDSSTRSARYDEDSTAGSDAGKKSLPTAHSVSSTKKRPWRKPKDMPKRPLSAYNLFFADERKKLLAAREQESNDYRSISRDIFSNSAPASAPPSKKLGFAGLARSVAAKWKTLDAVAKSAYEKQADVEKARYKAQMKDYNEQRLRAQQQATMASGLDSTSLNTAWPAMPQTIANLGNIYDSATEQGKPSSLDSSYGTASSIGDAAASSGLVLPKGQYYGGQQDLYAPASAIGSGFSSRPQSYDTFQRSSWTAAPSASAAMINWSDERGLARRLSSPGNISILAQELGQEQVDFFLNSLKDEDKDENKDQGMRK